MGREFFLMAITMAGAHMAVSQDSATVTEKPKPIISGSVDGYYRWNFANPRADDNNFNNKTSFTNSHNSFELGMASIKAEHSIGKVGAVIDLGFGRRAEEFSYNDDKTMLAIKQAYLFYSPTSNLKFTFGSFA